MQIVHVAAIKRCHSDLPLEGARLIDASSWIHRGTGLEALLPPGLGLARDWARWGCYGSPLLQDRDSSDEPAGFRDAPSTC